MREPGTSQRIGGLEVTVYEHADAVAEAALWQLRRALAGRADALVGFATGGTFRRMFDRIAEEAASGRLGLESLIATHLDEYLGFGSTDPGGMVHELTTVCPPLLGLLRDGRLWPVPADGGDDRLAAHERRVLARGIDLQFLGIGRNGHIAFNEPGTSFELGFHVTQLAQTTRDDARTRFAPDEPPRRAATSGPRTILAARQIVLAATGRAKAPAVAAMLRGPVDPRCPASVLRRHPNAVVLLDRDAAATLAAPREAAT